MYEKCFASSATNIATISLTCFIWRTGMSVFVFVVVGSWFCVTGLTNSHGYPFLFQLYVRETSMKMVCIIVDRTNTVKMSLPISIGINSRPIDPDRWWLSSWHQVMLVHSKLSLFITVMLINDYLSFSEENPAGFYWLFVLVDVTGGILAIVFVCFNSTSVSFVTCFAFVPFIL